METSYPKVIKFVRDWQIVSSNVGSSSTTKTNKTLEIRFHSLFFQTRGNVIFKTANLECNKEMEIVSLVSAEREQW